MLVFLYWYFYCLLYFIVGIMAGITQGEWSYFIIGLIGCVGHVLFIPMIWLYKYLFKKMIGLKQLFVHYESTKIFKRYSAETLKKKQST